MQLLAKNILFMGAACWLLYIWVSGDHTYLIVAILLFLLTGFWLNRHGREKKTIADIEEAEATSSSNDRKEKKNPAGAIILLSVLGWLVYNYIYDDTRAGHPNYSTGKAHEMCVNSAKVIADETALELSVDPSIWQLQGYRSSKEMVQATYQSVYSNCMR